LAGCEFSMDKTKLLAVVGPTASGKSALAANLAKILSGEVVSCDSMQIYEGFSIATAVPTKEEMLGVAHHLLSFAPADSVFSVAQYCELAKDCIADISARGKLPVLCGGTGLYYNSLVDGIVFADIDSDESLREELLSRILSEGGEVLIEELAQFDPESARRLEPADHKRIIRAIEVYRATGITMTEHIRRSRENGSDYELCVIGLGFNDRDVLYDRINRRVDEMIEKGLLEETKQFYAAAPGSTAVQAIGYKEMKPYLDGVCSFEDAVENLKRATRRYAKRQLTWFRRDKRINWLNVDGYDSFDKLLSDAVRIIKEELYGTKKQ